MRIQKTIETLKQKITMDSHLETLEEHKRRRNATQKNEKRKKKKQNSKVEEIKLGK